MNARRQRARRQKNAANQRRRNAGGEPHVPPTIPEVELPDGSVVFTLDAVDYTITRGAMFRDTITPGLQFSVTRQLTDGILFIVVWEEYSGSTRVTASMTNGIASTGIIYIDECEIQSTDDNSVTTEMKDLNGTGWSGGGFGGLQIRGTYVTRINTGDAFYRSTKPLKASWQEQLIQDGYDEIFTGNRYAVYGPYVICDPEVSGEDSLPGSYGGYKVTPSHFGTDGWQAASSVGYKWAELEFMATLHRSPLASYDATTLEPDNPDAAYWTGRASSDLPGLEVGHPGGTPVADPVISELNDHKAHANAHFHRCSAAPAFLAPRDIFARIVLVEMYWNDFTCHWDGGGTSSDSQYYWTLQVAMDEKTPSSGWEFSGRGMSHSLGCYTFAKPYMAGSARGVTAPVRDMDKTQAGEAWTDHWNDFLDFIMMPNSGVIHNQDYAGSNGVGDEQYPLVQNAGRSRETDLLIRPLQRLGGRADQLAILYSFMAKDPVEGSAPHASDGTGEHWTDELWGGVAHFPAYDIIRGDLTEWDITEIGGSPDVAQQSPRENLLALFSAADYAAMADYTP